VNTEARASLKARDEIFPRADALYNKELSAVFCHHMEKQMTKMTFVSAVLIAATVFATQAMAARHDPAARHATTKDCVRTPNVGAYASDPYSVPPCLPNTAADTFQ
jgi:hypothetical protein